MKKRKPWRYRLYYCEECGYKWVTRKRPNRCPLFYCESYKILSRLINDDETELINKAIKEDKENRVNNIVKMEQKYAKSSS